MPKRVYIYIAPIIAMASVIVASPTLAAAANPSAGQPAFVFGIPVDFILFALTLLGVAIFHHKTLQVFGSSAGVAISNMYPEEKSVGRWLKHGCYIAVTYVVGFFVMLAMLGWNPDPQHRKRAELPSTQMAEMTLGGVR